MSVNMLAWYKVKVPAAQCLTDVMYSYMQGKSGLGNVSYASHLGKVLTTLGYGGGSLREQLRNFYVAKTGLSASLDFDYLETQFYVNNGLDFI